MPNIKQITLPSGTTYDIVDQGARELIAALEGSTAYLGVTTTELVDNVTTDPSIVVAGETVTAQAGGIATYGSKEFIYNGTVWQEFGDLSALGALAFKSSAEGTFTPAGTIGEQTFNGSSSTFTGNYTAEGTVVISEGTGTPNYTPAGTVSQPTITVTPTEGTVNSITDVGTLPTLTTTVENENLTISFSPGELPTQGSDQTVVTGIESATATQPTFTGTGVELAASFNGTSHPVEVTGTPSGTISQATFTGTAGTVEVS